MYDYLMHFPGGIFGDLDRVRREIDSLFGHPAASQGIRAAASGSFPPINIGATPESTEVFVFAAGIDPAKLDVTLDKGVLTIAGERPADLPADGDKTSVYRQERFRGKFKRAISVPDDVDPDQVTARYRDGVLNISLKRTTASRMKRITVS